MSICVCDVYEVRVSVTTKEIHGKGNCVKFS